MQKKTEELFVLFPGKDARLYVFRLSTIKKGLEERQLIRGKCDSRENKLEKTKGNAQDLQEYAHRMQNNPHSEKGKYTYAR